MHESGPTAGLLAVAAAAALWAVAATVAAGLFEDGVDPIHLAEARAVVATAGLALIPGAWTRRRRPVPVITLVALGISIALVNAAYYLAIDRLAVAVAVVLQYTAPAMVVAWIAAASRRRPSPRILAALVLAIAGVILVSGLVARGAGRIDTFGVLMGLAAAVLFATYTLLSERAAAGYGSIGAMSRAFVVASIVWIVLQAPRGFPIALVDAMNVWRVLYVGIAGTLVPFLLFVWGIGRIRAERAAIGATLEPVLAGVIAFAFLGQTLTATQISGGVLVIIAVLSLQTRRRKPIIAAEP